MSETQIDEWPPLYDGKPDWGALLPGEIFWRDNYNWLDDCGYVLRSRYKPDWVPSWRATPGKWYIDCEDGLKSQVKNRRPSTLAVLI